MGKDNNGFLIFIVAVLVIVVFFNIKPISNTGTQPSDETISAGNTATTAEEIENQIEDLQQDVADLGKEIEQAVLNEKRSPFFEKVTIDYIRTSYNNNASDEYVQLYSRDLDAPISLAGWKLRSRYTGISVDIPQTVSNTYLPNRQSLETQLVLPSYSTVYLISTRSPVAESFRINICTGYLEENYDFYPSLSLSCPYPIDDSPITLTPSTETCVDFIKNMSRCKTNKEQLPASFSQQCTQYINLELNYPHCVYRHRTDSNFYENKWFVYLDRGTTLWRDRNETIDLLDADGKIVDTYTN